MKPVNNKILVRCDINQKNSISINDVVFSTALNFETNYRERSPVVCEVVEGNETVFNGDIILCHHNTFYLPSPYHLGEDLFSIPFGSTLFAKILQDGSLWPICGNILCNRVEKEYSIPIPPELQEKYINKSIVIDGGLTRYKKGQTIFHLSNSYYEIVYVWGGQEKRIHKVNEQMVCGYKAE